MNDNLYVKILLFFRREIPRYCNSNPVTLYPDRDRDCNPASVELIFQFFLKARNPIFAVLTLKMSKSCPR